jgi:hypothetical protein
MLIMDPRPQEVVPMVGEGHAPVVAVLGSPLKS